MILLYRVVSLFQNLHSNTFVYFSGSIKSSFLTSGNAATNSRAFNYILSSRNVVGYPVSATSFNGRVTSVASTSMTANSQVSSTTTAGNIGVTIGAVIGSVLGASILVLGAFFGYRVYKNKHKHSRLIDGLGAENSLDYQSLQKDESSLKLEPTGSAFIPPIQKPSTIENGSNVIRDVSVTIPTVSSPMHRLNSPPISDAPRAPSAAVSVAVLDLTVDGNGKCNTSKMPDVELISFN